MMEQEETHPHQWDQLWGCCNGLSIGKKDQQSVGGSDRRMEGGRADLKELNKSLSTPGPSRVIGPKVTDWRLKSRQGMVPHH